MIDVRVKTNVIDTHMPIPDRTCPICLRMIDICICGIAAQHEAYEAYKFATVLDEGANTSTVPLAFWTGARNAILAMLIFGTIGGFIGWALITLWNYWSAK